jgi:hypothetical protein
VDVEPAQVATGGVDADAYEGVLVRVTDQPGNTILGARVDQL